MVYSSPKDLILLEVGHGFFPEVTIQEAGPIIVKRKKFYQEKIDRVAEEIIKLRSNITRVYFFSFQRSHFFTIVRKCIE